MIPGPAGNIEALVNDSNEGSWLILCHPHPLYGGSMFDAVLDTVEQAAAPMHLSTVRFNFRGVGSSDGEHEWKLHTKELVQERDPGLYNLLTDPQWDLPTELPDGSYCE